MDINKIMGKWVEFTEVNPTEHKFVITNKNVSIFDYNNKIKSALENGGELNCALMIKQCFFDLIQETYYSAFDIINETHEYRKKMQQANDLYNMLLDDEIIQYEKEVHDSINAAAEAYGISDKIKDLSDDDRILIMLNAQKACNLLDTVQFKKGTKGNITPKYIKPIRAFYDINQLLIAVASSDSFNGITLNCLIDESNTSYSYFCFIVKNGDNVWMISDRPRGSISTKFNSRADGRYMDERISVYMFPYELLGLQLTKDDATIKTTKLSDSSDGIMLGTIKNCSTESSLWVACCMSMLYRKFFIDDVEDFTMVVSGGMLALPKKDSNEIIPSGEIETALSLQYGLIPTKEIKADDVINGKNINYSEHYTRFHKNDWLLDKYASKIGEETYNIIGEKGLVDIKLDTGSYSMYSFEKNSIGTLEELENNRLWIARKNMAMQIAELYERDWKQQEMDLRRWYKEKLSERAEYISEIIGKEEVLLTTYEYRKIKPEFVETYKNGEKLPFDSTFTFSLSFDQKRKENCLKIVEKGDDFYSSYNYTHLYQLDEKRHEKSWFKNGPVANIYIITVNSAEAIAEILGLTVKDLPEMLQHYTSISSVGEGNTILNQLDPIEHIRNFVCDFPADIKVYVSKSEIKEFKKKYS